MENAMLFFHAVNHPVRSRVKTGISDQDLKIVFN
jgi:hypothetical protein